MLEFALTIAYISLAIYLIGRWKIFRIPDISPKVLNLLFIIKIVAALALYIIYTRFYTDRTYADIFRYYDDSAVIYNAFTHRPWDYFRMLTGFQGDAPELKGYYDAMRNWYNTDLAFNDSRTMIRINAFLRLFSMGTYFPHAVVMCFLAMLGLTGIFRVMKEMTKGRSFILIIIIYLLPSTLLWTSGMIKEAFLVFALGLLLYQVSMWKKEKAFSIRRLIGILLSVMILITVKAYIFFLFVPVVIVWLYSASWKKSPFLLTGIVFSAYFLLLALAAPFITGRDVPTLISDKQAEFYYVADAEHAKSVVQVNRIEPEWGSLIREIPGAFTRTLFLPLPQHAYNILMWFSAFENIFILFLSVIMLLSIRKEYLQHIPPFVVGALLFGCAVFILSGWVTPIIGALVRYKVPGLPFLLFPLTVISYRKWMDGNFLPWFKAGNS